MRAVKAFEDCLQFGLGDARTLIAHAHGGSVSVQSAEGAGSTFTLYVPGAIGKGRVGGQPLPTKAASA